MPARVLVVGTADVCRSPVIAGLLAARLGPTVEIVSRGLRAAQGTGICDTSSTWASARGLDVGGHAPAQLELADVRASTMILGATRRHRQTVLELRPSMQVRTFTLNQAARIATWVAAQGGRPGSADPSERVLWLTEQLDLARELAPAPPQERAEDLADPHYGADHAEVFSRIAGAVDALCAPILP